MKRITLLLLLITFTLTVVVAQNQWQESFNPFISQLVTTDPKVKDVTDLKVLDNLIKRKKIVALGEATHSTKEFFTTKHRLIKYLVEKHDFRVFVIEDDYTSTYNINAFITGKSDINGKKALFNNWSKAWFTQEVFDMVLWMKSFNEERDDDDKIRIYGCDMQWYQSSASYILSVLKKTNQIKPDIEKALKFLMKYRRSIKMTKKEKNNVRVLVDRLNSISVNNIESDKEKNDQLLFSIRTLEQSVDCLFKPGIVTSTILRDKYMAENCESIFKLEDNQRMIIWAHNQHIAEHSDNSKKKPMGSHLKKIFGDDYYTIGFGYYTGDFLAYVPEKKKFAPCNTGVPKEDCVDNIFAKAPYPNFIFNLQEVNLPIALSDMVNKASWSRRGSPAYKDPNARMNYRKCILSKSYNTLIFIRNSSSTHPLFYTP